MSKLANNATIQTHWKGKFWNPQINTHDDDYPLRITTINTTKGDQADARSRQILMQAIQLQAEGLFPRDLNN